jgi:hypothetical protein
MFSPRNRFPIATVAVLLLVSPVAAEAQSQETPQQRTERELTLLIQAAQEIENSRKELVQACTRTRPASQGLQSVSVVARTDGVPRKAVPVLRNDDVPPPPPAPGVVEVAPPPSDGTKGQGAPGQASVPAQVSLSPEVLAAINKAVEDAIAKHLAGQKAAVQQPTHTSTTTAQRVTCGCMSGKTIVVEVPYWTCGATYAVSGTASVACGRSFLVSSRRGGLLSCLVKLGHH